MIHSDDKMLLLFYFHFLNEEVMFYSASRISNKLHILFLLCCRPTCMYSAINPAFNLNLKTEAQINEVITQGWESEPESQSNKTAPKKYAYGNSNSENFRNPNLLFPFSSPKQTLNLSREKKQTSKQSKTKQSGRKC